MWYVHNEEDRDFLSLAGKFHRKATIIDCLKLWFTIMKHAFSWGDSLSILCASALISSQKFVRHRWSNHLQGYQKQVVRGRHWYCRAAFPEGYLAEDPPPYLRMDAVCVIAVALLLFYVWVVLDIRHLEPLGFCFFTIDEHLHFPSGQPFALFHSLSSTAWSITRQSHTPFNSRTIPSTTIFISTPERYESLYFSRYVSKEFSILVQRVNLWWGSFDDSLRKRQWHLYSQ